MRTAVVGGGVTGLVAARALAVSGHDVVLLEAAERLGGVVRTVRRDGYLIETGPESFVTRKPALLELCRELGLGEEIVFGRAGRTSVYARGALRPLPDGVAVLPTRLRPLLASGILSPLEKLRAIADLVLPAGELGGDATLGHVVGGRLGRGALDRLVAPLAAGIYGADPDRMSLAATFPEVLEIARRGSLIRQAARSRAAEIDTAVPPFATLRAGLGALVDRLVDDLQGTDLRTGAHVERVVRAGETWRLQVWGGGAVDAERLLLAVPAAEAARIVAVESPGTARLLAGFRRVSTAVVTLAYDAAAVAVPDGNGFVVARDAGLPITACTFSSWKWPGRAPEGRVLVRAYLGRIDDPLERGMADQGLVRRARAGLEAAMGWSAGPVLSRVDRAVDAMPQYDLGHLDRVAEVQRALAFLPGLAVAGADYGGIGLADCAAQGQTAARRLIGYHGGSRADREPWKE